MSEKDRETNGEIFDVEAKDWSDDLILEDVELSPIGSGELAAKNIEAISLEEILDTNSIELPDEDPIFAELAAPKLPALEKENRARLQMQSPTRIHFYWSIKNNPFQTLNRAFKGAAGNYTLVSKLVNKSTGSEEIFPVDAEGSRWLNVDADSLYQAELGFYAPNRPFVRIMFSNSLQTPRKSPSFRSAAESEWAISAKKFSAVLDESGYSQDAFDVALAGDDFQTAETAAKNAFAQFVGKDVRNDFSGEELRFALLALASGYTVEDLRGHIGASLFAYLVSNAASLSGEKAAGALGDHFEISLEEFEFEDEFFGDAVYGASLVHFPKFTAKRRSTLGKIGPGEFATGLLDKLSPIGSRRISS
ncbi:MAG: DUF4912 domain-containing protein [Pyrinomonadaceae bacterium]|nr:DUF4912 domain-containing protein [Pyrinomonadaceae bacterium]